jgi:DNA uptake protein ComE-like DNA-binding protein
MGVDLDANLANIRQFLYDFFSNEELTQFCFDHYFSVYQNFSESQTKGSKAMQLVAYCHNHHKLPDLLEKLERHRPIAFGEVFGKRSASFKVLVNINTASPDELQNLPGIGPRLAQAIIYGRPYSSVDELRLINGIGVRRISALRDWCVA